MPERDRYIPGVPCWADTSQPDPEAATEFYSGLFGWEFQDSMPPDSPGSYFIASLKGKAVAAVGAQPEGAPPEPMWNTYVSVAGADETAKKVRDAGGSIISEPFDVMDAGRMAVCMDPEGATFCVWQSEEMPGSQLVNEHGTVNFNVLNTRDGPLWNDWEDTCLGPLGWDAACLKLTREGGERAEAALAASGIELDPGELALWVEARSLQVAVWRAYLATS